MPATPATTYDEIVKFACRNVWTKYNAATVLSTQLRSWKDATFAIENNGQPLPAAVLLWEPVVVETIVTVGQTVYDPSRVVEVIQKTIFAFRDNPSVAPATEADVVVAFNTFWS